jgi:prevent-host-death family protein
MGPIDLTAVATVVKNMVMIKVNVNVFEVKAKLSEYLDRALAGERIVICRHNKPVAELRAIDDVRTEPRPVGPLPGRPLFEVPASFFEPLPPDELDGWEGAAAADPLTVREPDAQRRPVKVAEPSSPSGRQPPRRAPRRRT